MHSQPTTFSVLRALADGVSPVVRRHGVEKIFVAPPCWKRGLELPDGMRWSRRALLGPRVPVRGRRAYGASAVVDAQWPQDKLNSTRTPKLCFVLSGATTMRISDYMIHAVPGHGVLLPPGTPFDDGTDLVLNESTQPHNHCELLMLLPYHDGLLCWVSRRWCDAKRHWHKSEETVSVPHSQASFYIERLNAEATGAGSYRIEICRGLLGVALALLQRELQELPVIRTGEVERKGQLVPAAHREYSLAQAEAYIRHNLRESLSINKVARHLCLSRTTFTAQFRATTGKTFSQYVADLRFAEAERLLRESDLAVRHVCALVGLQPCRLRTLFQERKGISPTQFRRENQHTDATNKSIGR
jgi:AraC-like DNA-binding protein